MAKTVLITGASSGFGSPLGFYQAGLIHAWFSKMGDPPIQRH